MGFNFATSRIYNVVRILCLSLTCMQRGIIMFTMFSVISFPYMLSVMPESNHRFLNFVHTLLFKIILYYVEIRMIQLLIFVFWMYKKLQDNFKLIPPNNECLSLIEEKRKAKSIWIFKNMEKFWSISLATFIEHKPLLSEECGRLLSR